MPIFSLAGAAIAGALFGGSAIAATLIAGGLAFGASLLMQSLNRPKQRAYAAVQGEIQYGADVPASTLFGPGKTKGHHIFYAKWGSGNKFNADVLLLANGWCDGLEPVVFFEGERRTLVTRPVIGNEAAHYGVSGFGTLISIRFYDGRPGQGVDTKLVADTAGLGQNWKNTSRCAGLTYVVLERQYDAEKFKSRAEFEFVLRGLREYDPRKDSTVAGGSGPQRLGTPSTWVYTQNPAVHRLNYQLGLRGLISGRTLIGEGKSLGQLDLGSYIASMNACDAVRAGKPTYQCGLFVNAEDDHTEILKEFDDAMAGYALNRRGLSGVVAGAPQIPVVSITANDIPIDRAQDLKRRKSAFELYNYMSGQFISREAHWTPDSLKPVYVNADVAADGRPRQTRNDFLQVSDPDIAQYLLNIRYRQNRKGGSATVPVSRRVGFAVQEGEWVTFDGKSWLVTGWRADAQLRVTLTLSETGADVYSSAGISPGPIVIPPTAPINPSLLSTVQNFDVEAGLLNGTGGLDVPVLRFTWTPPDDPTITAVRIVYKVNSGAGADSATELQYDVAVNPESGRYITSKNVESDKVYVARATITTVPDRLKTFTPWASTILATGRAYSDVLAGSIIATKLADAAVTASKLMDGAVTSLKLADRAVSTTKIALAALTSELLASGAVVADKLANGAVTITKFASGLTPIEIVGSLPSTGNFEGRQVFLTTDDKLYRHAGSPSGTAGFTSAVAADDLAGQITATQITDGAISTPKLAAGAVAADKIAANAVTADKIIANAVTTAKIAAGAVTATEVAANAITTAKIAAGAVTATEIAANAIIADKIATNAITTAKIAAGAVTATEIATGAVTAVKISAGAVTADKVAANSITGDKLVANSITARELILTDFENLVPNGSFVNGDAAGWTLPAGVTVVSGPSDAPTQYVLKFDETTVDRYANAIGLNIISCQPGDQFLFRVDAETTGAPRKSRIHLRAGFIDNTGASLGLALVVADSGDMSSTSFSTISGTFTVPPGAAGITALTVRKVAQADSSGGLNVTNVAVFRRASAELIVDGAITADKLAVNAIIAGKIAAGAINTASLFVDGVVITDVIANNAVTVANAVVSTNEDSTGNTNADHTIQTFAINPTGNRLIVRALATLWMNGTTYYGTIKLKKNGTTMVSAAIGAAQFPRTQWGLAYVDNSPSNATWTLTVSGNVGGGGHIGNVFNYGFRSIDYLNSKR
ncbi:phage tail protein [Devosia sp. 2618]|uniref:phage tail protein n=1 Tax=Devosia sp. 2618 TaxID=3156454 RepID=UPI003391A95B